MDGEKGWHVKGERNELIFISNILEECRRGDLRELGTGKERQTFILETSCITRSALKQELLASSPSTLNTACSEQLLDSPLQGTLGRKVFWLKLGRSRWHSPAVSNFALVGTTAVLGLLTACVQWGRGVGREQTSPGWCLTASQAPGCLFQAGSWKQQRTQRALQGRASSGSGVLSFRPLL